MTTQPYTPEELAHWRGLVADPVLEGHDVVATVHTIARFLATVDQYSGIHEAKVKQWAIDAPLSPFAPDSEGGNVKTPAPVGVNELIEELIGLAPYSEISVLVKEILSRFNVTRREST